MMFVSLVILAVFTSSLAQMMLKRGAMVSSLAFSQQYLNRWVVGGYAILGMALLLNIFCLGHGIQIKEISAAEALGYLFVPLLSRLFFGELITMQKSVAIAVIMAGVLVFFS